MLYEVVKDFGVTVAGTRYPHGSTIDTEKLEKDGLKELEALAQTGQDVVALKDSPKPSRAAKPDEKEG